MQGFGVEGQGSETSGSGLRVYRNPKEPTFSRTCIMNSIRRSPKKVGSFGVQVGVKDAEGWGITVEGLRVNVWERGPRAPEP